MNNMITDNGDTMYWVVRINGQNVTAPVSSQQLAEMERMRLNSDQQPLAEIVPVTADGKQVLFD